jgi:creatinine amidohydrolase
MMLGRAALVGLVSGLLCGSAAAQVLSVAELNVDRIRALDRQRTVVILPGGILEQHGPYLPSYSDGYYGERLARDVAEAVAGRAGWTALVFPPLPLGALGANEIGGKRSFPGSYTVRAATLRAVYMDLASQLGDQGFRWVFVVHNHGGPSHNRALDEAADYFQETYGGRMVHLLGSMDAVTCCEEWRRLVSPDAVADDGLSVHAGLVEHSGLLFLRPDLVPAAFRQAPSITATSFEGLVAAARRSDWPGYFGAPRHATAAVGASFYRQQSGLVVASALKILDGPPAASGARYSDEIVKNPVVAAIVADSLAGDRALEARQEAWLKRQSPWPPGPRR